MITGYGLKYSLVASVALLTLSGCSPEPSATAEQNNTADDRFKHTVAEARNTPWPEGGAAEPDALDPLLTRTNYMIVLDMSGSMGSRECAGAYNDKSAAAKAALNAWVDNVDHQANLGLIIFDGQGPSIRVNLGQDNRSAFRQHVNTSSPAGGTPLQTSLRLAHQELTERARYQQGYGTYRLMVITDGEHSDGEDPSQEIERIAGNAANPIELHTIGFCIDDSALNQPGVTLYRSAQNPEELARGLDSVLAESQDFANIQEFTGNDL